MKNDRKTLQNFYFQQLIKLVLLSTMLFIFINFINCEIDFTSKTFVALPVIIEKPIITKVSIDIDSFIKPQGKPVIFGEKSSDLFINSSFGLRVHPISKQLKFHTGVDIGCPIGCPIVSTAYGKVIRIQYQSTGYGNNIVIEHNGTYRTLYAHLDEISVKVNQVIEKGEVIGYSGNTGHSTAPHLHYEVVHNNKKIDPQPYL